MRDCDFIHDSIDDWIEGLLENSAQVRFDEHLAICHRCAAFAEAERQITHDLAALSGIASRIAHEGETRVPTKGHTWTIRRIAAAITLFVVGGTSAVVMMRQAIRSGSSTAPVVSRVAPAEPSAPTTSFTLPEGDTRLSVRVDSDNPRVHMYWIYETVSAPDASADHEAPGDTGPGGAAPDTNRS
ncbi:MAG: zf-HC2 domain-containing protein [Phycisphaerales bacterium]|nr:zf-HC2 domain-containing protein [Phycisphaerales bacterium]MCB9855606.1 zf-HC2 domain-containing protein [Phycisphaerales bacterium]MCB9864905.1 zf-HC2 domain-containing protein [Phycisphaerales bacterium]